MKQDPEEWFKWRPIGSEDNNLDIAAIEALLAERSEAREGKNFERSHAIREDLATQGIVLEDGPGGTIWRRC